MALLNILEFPDPKLRTVAQPVAVVDVAIKQLVADMLETMYAAPGIGLAATQVDVHEQVVVIDVSEEGNQPLVLINPQITHTTGSTTYQEGCLSVPEIYADVERADEIDVQALNELGESIQFHADGLLAICIQHECDHLLGKLFVDYLSPLKRQRVRKKLAKNRRNQAV